MPYTPVLSLWETQIAIKQLKDFFQVELAKALNLTRVTAPLFVRPETGLNDNLSGVERPVSFGIGEQGDEPCEIVQSLAKWKRMALDRYGFTVGSGLYTDMNAIRRDEDTDALHSLYVDQWDWECVIRPEQRTLETLKDYVTRIYDVFYRTEAFIAGKYSHLRRFLPPRISFFTARELEDAYPAMTPEEREAEVARKNGAVFIMQIGEKLQSGQIHSARAPDYDDWTLNGDMILHYPLLNIPMELSSMGIRVDGNRLQVQLAKAGLEERSRLPFHKSVLEGKLPQTIGGGIGQSRLCMFFLEKAHIGEVQVSVWREDTIEECARNGILLL